MHRDLGLRLLCVAMLSLVSVAASQTSHHPDSGYIPHRVYDCEEKRFSDFEAMLADLARADVVFVGEQHDDPATHRLERAILEGLARRRSNMVVAMEMFERDVQSALDEYLAGRLSEAEFLKVARPWPRYATDYRPLVEFARAHGWRVVASNVPRRYASSVSKSGLVALEAVPAAERKLMATRIHCPLDDYFKRFARQMNSHPDTSGQPAGQQPESQQRAMIERFYYAQCLKDETMAESIAEVLLNHSGPLPRPLVVHFNGAFHSDYYFGAAARTKQRLTKSQIKVLSIVPVEDLDRVKAGDYRKHGDYVIFTLKSSGPKTTPSN